MSAPTANLNGSVADKSLGMHNYDFPNEHTDTPIGDSETTSRWEMAVILTLISLMYVMSTILTGLLGAANGKIADSIKLSEDLRFWPASVFSSSCGCTLIFSSSLTDLIGPRRIYLVGSFLCASLILSCGLARDGTQLIAFRALQGVAVAFCLPASFSIITSTFPLG